MEQVIIPILRKHYKPALRAKDEAIAVAVGAALDDVSLMRHTHVNGGTVSSMTQAVREAAYTGAATPWARMYTLQVARWLAISLRLLSDESHVQRNPEIPELYEFFSTFETEDSYMRSRKTWRPRA